VVPRVGLGVLQFKTLRRFLTRVVDARWSVGTQEISAESAAQAVKVASRYTPRSRTCLTQTLATQVLLARRGHPAILRTGVARGSGDNLEPHAWVESGGKVVIGGHDLERYTQLATLGETP